MEFPNQQLWGTNCSWFSISSSVICCVPRNWSQRQLLVPKRRQQHPFNPLQHHYHHSSPAGHGQWTPQGSCQAHGPSKSKHHAAFSSASLLQELVLITHSHRRLRKKVKKNPKQTAWEDAHEANLLPASGRGSAQQESCAQPCSAWAVWPPVCPVYLGILVRWQDLTQHWSTPSRCVREFAADLDWQPLWKPSMAFSTQPEYAESRSSFHLTNITGICG